MKTTPLLLALLLADPLSLCAREWRDTKGRTFHGVLVAVEGNNVTFEKYGAGPFTVALSTSCEADRAYIAEWKRARASAIMIRAEVFQAVKTGALVRGVELVPTVRLEDVPKWYSKLDQRVVTEKARTPVFEWHKLPTEEVFIEGLDDVLDKLMIGCLTVWPAGFHDYTTAAGAFRRVAKYTLTPPAAK